MLINQQQNQSTDFHRRMLRNAIDVRWPNKISSKDLYEKTQQKPWSSEITKRRLRLYGPLMGLPEETPIRYQWKNVKDHSIWQEEPASSHG